MIYYACLSLLYLLSPVKILAVDRNVAPYKYAMPGGDTSHIEGKRVTQNT